LALLTALAGCSREVNIRDEPEGGVTGGSGVFEPDASVPLVDAGLESGAYAVCEERPEGDCRGTNDFACEFERWARAVARDCFVLAGCFSNGWLVLDIGDDGCVTGIRMEHPDPGYVDCLVASLGNYRCPCRAGQVTHFLGLGNDGCEDAGSLECRSGEFPCPVGYTCVDQVCVAEPGSAGAPGR